MNLQLERAAVAAIMLGADPLDADPRDFPSLRTAVQVALELRARGDLPTLPLIAAELSRRGLSAFNPELAGVFEEATTANNFAGHLAALKRARRIREAREAAARIVEGGDGFAAASEAIARAGLDDCKREARHAKDGLPAVFEFGDDAAVPLGLAGLRNLRVCAGNLCFIGARPGAGKTSMLGTIALAAAKLCWDVLFISLEMPTAEILRRLLAAESGMPLSGIRPGRIPTDAAANLCVQPLWIEDGMPLKPHEPRLPLDLEGIGALIGSWKGWNVHRVVLIDYAQLIRVRSLRIERRHELLGHVCRELKRFARDNSLPIIAAAQVGREAEKRGPNAVPQLSDLRESGEIENTADSVLLLHLVGAPSDRAMLRVAKQRMGPMFTAEAEFDAPRCRFLDPLEGY